MKRKIPVTVDFSYTVFAGDYDYRNGHSKVITMGNLAPVIFYSRYFCRNKYGPIWLLVILLSVQAHPLRAQLPTETLQRWADVYTRAYRQQQAWPELPESAEWNQEMAYLLQTEVNNRHLQEESVLGFKAGLTSPAYQKQFAVNQPLLGVLFQSHELPIRLIKQRQFQRGMMELELAFQFDRAISQPVKDVATLRQWVREVRAVIEIPDVNFAGDGRPSATELIASNVAAKSLFFGQPVVLADMDPDSIEVTLQTASGEMLLQEKAGIVMDSQWQALLWMVNRALANGWQIQPRYWLLTGAIGGGLELQAGVYRAEFSGLETLNFTVE